MLKSIGAFVCLFEEGCPLLGGSVKRGSTVDISKWATKNHKARSNCITLSSFVEPFLMAGTTPVLSH